MKTAVRGAAFVLCIVVAVSELSSGSAASEMGKGTTVDKIDQTWTNAQSVEKNSDGRSRRDDFGLVGPTWSAGARLDEREIAEIAATVQDTKDTVQGILWAANIIMGQLYEIFIN